MECALILEEKLSQNFELQILVGNKYELSKFPTVVNHMWTAFVLLKPNNSILDRFVEKVRFGCHPSLGFKYQEVKAPCDLFQINSREPPHLMQIQIYFRQETGINPRVLKVDHMVELQSGGKWTKHKVQIYKSIYDNLISK